MSQLFVVATPIGNLEDITLRALETLRQSRLIVCEDTRHTRKLLSKYDIHVPTAAFHAHSDRDAVVRLVERIAELENVSLVTDAGTPGISDPGSILVDACRDADIVVVPIPGPSALATLVSVAGAVGRTITFDGFLSPKSGRRRNRLRELLKRSETFVVYESPHRIVKLLRDLADEYPEAHVVVGRELTKAFEEIRTGTARQLADEFAGRPNVKGECAILVRATGIR